MQVVSKGAIITQYDTFGVFKWENKMNYKTVKLPADFIDEVKSSATEEFRSVSQQLLYWATLGRNVAQSYFTDEDDSELGQLALKRYQEEKHLAVKVNLNDL